MAEPQAIPAQQVPRIKPAHSFISGQISSRRVINTQAGGRMWLTVVRLPAEDEFSMPSTIEIRSSASFGDVGERWQGIVKIGGYARSFTTKPDPETGEVKAVKSAQVSLELVE